MQVQVILLENDKETIEYNQGILVGAIKALELGRIEKYNFASKYIAFLFICNTNELNAIIKVLNNEGIRFRIGDREIKLEK